MHIKMGWRNAMRALRQFPVNGMAQVANVEKESRRKTAICRDFISLREVS